METRCLDCSWAPAPGELWPSEGGLACKWFKKNLILPEGSTFGQPFIPRPDQREFIYEWYSYCGGCGRWRYKEALRGESTGGGKTTLLAGIALLEFAGPPGIAPISPNIVVAAASRGQANNLFRKVSQMAGGRDDAIKESPLCGLFHVFENVIRFKDGRPGEIERVAAEAGTNEGGYPSLFICDELHEWNGNIARNKTVISKALAVSTPLVTPSGWITMADVSVGDTLFDEKGRKCNVTGVSPVFIGHDCYEVVFSDGAVITADAEHLWSVEEYKSGIYNPITLTTQEMHEKGAIFNSQSQNRRKRFRLRMQNPLDTDECNLLVDPYILGAWLGDGTSANSQFTIHADDYDEFLVSVKQAGYHELSVNWWSKVDTLTVNVSVSPTPGGRGSRSQDTLYGRLKTLNVLNNKHIPEIYLRSSIEQRLALLQGLMDTDGTVAKIGTCAFTNKNKSIIDSFCELLSTMGLKFTVKEYMSKLHKDGVVKECGIVWTVYFTAQDNIPVFRLMRKADRVSHANPHSKVSIRQIIDIRPVESVPTKCVAVDSPSHLYLAGKKMVPTHNSTTKREDLRGTGRVLGISTAGFDKNNSLLGDMYKKGKICQHDPSYDPEFYFTWYEADENLNPDDPLDRRKMVMQASPAAGVTWNVEARVRKWKQPDMPPHEWLRYYANRWVDVGKNSWLKDHPGVWAACKGTWETSSQNPFTIGVDMALRHDTVGVVRCERLPDGRTAVTHKIWKADQMTGRIDHVDVWDYVVSIAKGEGFRGVVYDPRYFELPARMLEERGILAVQFDQNPARMAPASGYAFKLIVENKIVHNGDPDLADQVTSAVAKMVERGGFFVHKGASKRNIDSCAAMVMAAYELDLAVDMKPYGVHPPSGDENFWRPKKSAWGSDSSLWG